MPNLDPKLKEAYERVMGTNVTPSALPVQPTPAAPAPAPAPMITTPKVVSPPPPPPEVTPASKMEPITVGPTAIPSSGVGYVAPTVEGAAANTQKISPVIFAVAAFVFFIVYSLFWIKFFNLSLPFLPS